MDPGAFLGDPAMRELRWSTPMNETKGILGWSGESGWPQELCSDTSGLIRIRIRRALSGAGRQNHYTDKNFSALTSKRRVLILLESLGSASYTGPPPYTVGPHRATTEAP
jgi:hypothetical protein